MHSLPDTKLIGSGHLCRVLWTYWVWPFAYDNCQHNFKFTRTLSDSPHLSSSKRFITSMIRYVWGNTESFDIKAGRFRKDRPIEPMIVWNSAKWNKSWMEAGSNPWSSNANYLNLIIFRGYLHINLLPIISWPFINLSSTPIHKIFSRLSLRKLYGRLKRYSTAARN